MNSSSLWNKINYILIILLLFFTIGCASSDYLNYDNQNSQLSSEQSISKLIVKVILKFEEAVSNKKHTVKIGAVTYENTDQPTVFSSYLKSILSYQIRLSQKFVEIAGEELMKNNPFLFGIEKSDYYINVAYWNKDDFLLCQFSLIESMSSIKKEVFKIDIKKNDIPNGITYTPSKNSEDILKFKNAVITGKHDFSLDLWTAKGVSPVFKIGDKLTFYLLAQLDCYIKIYHVNADDEIVLLYPNLYQSDNYIKAEKVLQIPGIKETFEFLLKPPVGIEYVYVIASTVQFNDIPILKDTTFYSIGKNTDASQSSVKKALTITNNNALVSEATLAYIISE